MNSREKFGWNSCVKQDYDPTPPKPHLLQSDKEISRETKEKGSVTRVHRHDQKIKLRWPDPEQLWNFQNKNIYPQAEFYFREAVQWFDKYALFAGLEVLESEKLWLGSAVGRDKKVNPYLTKNQSNSRINYPALLEKIRHLLIQLRTSSTVDPYFVDWPLFNLSLL